MRSPRSTSSRTSDGPSAVNSWLPIFKPADVRTDAIGHAHGFARRGHVQGREDAIHAGSWMAVRVHGADRSLMRATSWRVM